MHAARAFGAYAQEPAKTLTFASFLRMPCPTEADADTATVFVEEFNAGGLQRTANGQVVRHRHRCFFFRELRAADGGETQSALTGEIFGAPTNEGTSGSDLGAGQGFWAHPGLLCV